MRYFKGILAATIGMLGAGSVAAQDMDVQGDGSNGNIVFQAKNTSTASSDKVGVMGYSVPQPYYGIGVKGVGGYKGVVGEAGAISNTGTRVGVEAFAAGGSTNYALRGYALGAQGTNYGVFAQASGTNSRAGKFVGSLEYTGTLYPTSDRRFKKNIKDIRNCVGIVNRLSPKEYEYRTEEFPEMNFDASHQFGLIAQEVEAVLPDLVSESEGVPVLDDSKGKAGEPKLKSYKNLNYMGLIPVLIGALQEQQAQIEALTKKLAEARK